MSPEAYIYLVRRVKHYAAASIGLAFMAFAGWLLCQAFMGGN